MEQNIQKTPLVSVIMPAYNAEAYIEESIRSALNQTVDDIELIVIDDGSTDGTRACIKRLAEADPRIFPVYNEENLGVARSRNKGMRLSRGAYVALLDSDDFWYPEKLERQIELAKREKADIVYCGYAMVDESGSSICKDYIVPEHTSLEDLLKNNCLSCSTTMLSGAVAEKYEFQTEYYHEDYALWLLLLQDGWKAVGVPEPLAAYRLRSGSRASNKLLSAVRRFKIYRSYLGFSFVKSAWITTQYALLGLRKYRRC